MKLLRALALVMATALLPLISPGTANAVTTVEAWGKDVTVRYGGCESTKVGATGDWTSDASSEVEIDVYDPSGDWFDGAYFDRNKDGSVNTRVSLCSFDREGRYRVRVKVTSYDDEGTKTVQKDWSPFKYTYIEKAKSRIVRNVDYRPKKKVYKYAAVGRLLRKGHGYGDRLVTLQTNIGGYWYDIQRMRTGKRGHFGWVFKPNPYRWRYVYSGNTNTRASTSDPFRTPRKGAGRISADPLPSDLVTSYRSAG